MQNNKEKRDPSVVTMTDKYCLPILISFLNQKRIVNTLINAMEYDESDALIALVGGNNIILSSLVTYLGWFKGESCKDYIAIIKFLVEPDSQNKTIEEIIGGLRFIVNNPSSDGLLKTIQVLRYWNKRISESLENKLKDVEQNYPDFEIRVKQLTIKRMVEIIDAGLKKNRSIIINSLRNLSC
ncbi:MAG: hypothetical protein D6732_17615 [Methanobacteriota archaeon]|nr:MAG: hypothetical protein D6732_17615 [Euryarchaeota archaeon]